MARKLLLGLFLLLVGVSLAPGQSASPQWRSAPVGGSPSMTLPGQATSEAPTTGIPSMRAYLAPPAQHVVAPPPAQLPAAVMSMETQPVQSAPLPATATTRQGTQPAPVRPAFPTNPMGPVPSRTPSSGIQLVQAPADTYKSTITEISLELPGPERIFNRLDNEAAWQERLRQEARDRPGPDRNITFPDEVTLTTAPYTGRNWPRQMTYVEPNYLIYNRLYFEERNSERYGWDLGPLSPVVSTLYFYRDTMLFPYNFGSDICRRFETNAGYCLPGDPVPYLLYPPGASLTGAGTETATLLILLAAFP